MYTLLESHFITGRGINSNITNQIFKFAKLEKVIKKISTGKEDKHPFNSSSNLKKKVALNTAC